MMFDFLDGMVFAMILQISGGGMVLGYMLLKLKREEVKAEQKKYAFFDIVSKRMRKHSRSSSAKER